MYLSTEQARVIKEAVQRSKMETAIKVCEALAAIKEKTMRYWVIWLALRLFNRNRFWLIIPNPGCNHSWRLLFVAKDWGQGNGPSRVLASGLTDKSDIAKLCESYGVYPEY